MKQISETRAELKNEIKILPLIAQNLLNNNDDCCERSIIVDSEEEGNLGFKVTYKDIRQSILIPKYYNPKIDVELANLSPTHDLVTLKQLIADDAIVWETGTEVGKMAYGTGAIPFVRTSDIANWELKSDPKQGVSQEIFEQHKQSVEPEDLFIVRDGTYLVGTSCLLTEHDTKILFCGGLYKLRVNKRNEINPYLLLVLLNMPIVTKQMRAKQFTRDVIDTLGSRLFEVVIPIPKDNKQRQKLIDGARTIIQTRANLREKAKKIFQDYGSLIGTHMEES